MVLAADDDGVIDCPAQGLVSRNTFFGRVEFEIQSLRGWGDVGIVYHVTDAGTYSALWISELLGQLSFRHVRFVDGNAVRTSTKSISSRDLHEVYEHFSYSEPAVISMWTDAAGSAVSIDNYTWFSVSSGNLRPVESAMYLCTDFGDGNRIAYHEGNLGSTSSGTRLSRRFEIRDFETYWEWAN